MPWHCQSIAIAVRWQCHSDTMTLPWHCCGTVMALLSQSNALPWQCLAGSMTMQWHCHGAAWALPRHWHGTAMTPPWHCHGAVMALPWRYYASVPLQIFIVARPGGLRHMNLETYHCVVQLCRGCDSEPHEMTKPLSAAAPVRYRKNKANYIAPREQQWPRYDVATDHCLHPYNGAVPVGYDDLLSMLDLTRD